MPTLKAVPRRRVDDEKLYAGPPRLRFDRLSGGEAVVRVVLDPRQLEFPFVERLPKVLPWSERRPFERETPWWMRMFDDLDDHPLHTERRQAFLVFLDLEMKRELRAKLITESWDRMLSPGYAEDRHRWLASPAYARQALLVREAFFDRVGFFPRVVASPPPGAPAPSEPPGTHIAPWVVPPPSSNELAEPAPSRPPPPPLYFAHLYRFIAEWADRTGERPPPEIPMMDWLSLLEDSLLPYYAGAVPRVR